MSSTSRWPLAPVTWISNHIHVFLQLFLHILICVILSNLMWKIGHGGGGITLSYVMLMQLLSPVQSPNEFSVYMLKKDDLMKMFMRMVLDTETEQHAA